MAALDQGVQASSVRSSYGTDSTGKDAVEYADARQHYEHHLFVHHTFSSPVPYAGTGAFPLQMKALATGIFKLLVTSQTA